MKVVTTSLSRILLGLIVFVLSACSAAAPSGVESPAAATEQPTAVTAAATAVPPTETAPPPAEAELQLATIESLQVLTADEAGGATTVQIRGTLPNDCAAIDNVVTQRSGNEFKLVVLTRQQSGEDCSTEPVPFEQVVELDVSGLEAGSYQVTANDRQVSFNLETAVVAATPEATVGAPSGLASVAGVVWHDVCANDQTAVESVPAGCIVNSTNVVLGDGERQDGEEGLAGVQVAIGEGECPAAAVSAVTTAADGSYGFSDLAAGTYCVFVDTADTLTQELLGDGFWTAPDAETAQRTLTVGAGDVVENVDFGWDFLNLPAVEVDLTNCTNSFEFVEDLSIPDDTIFPPGADFTKQWQLRNNGTCPWSTEYSVVFVGGDQMSADDAYPLQKAVAPGQTLDVAIDMVTPDQTGTYRGNWQIADANGDPFGIDGFIEDAFWLQIVVEENAPPVQTPQPNSGALGGVVWDDLCLNSNPGTGCVETPEGSGVFVADGSFGASEAPLSDIVISLAEGLCPADGTLPTGVTVLATAVTDTEGRYQFDGLSEGSYCIYMDALSADMVDLLIPGNWTWPATGVGTYSVALDPGERILDLDFGWDFAD